MFALTGPPPARSAQPGGDDGMATAEYALCAVIGAAFAGVLYVIITSGEVREALTALVVDALSSGF
ncbi:MULTISPECIES: DUF4244 domain-containing protein [Nocardiopsidaceae]|uniref:DUF4244 domain-containing protein n=1 Tax=Streptomonospora nanhaiensis TaxID=1323731 RepID=A0ABY6YN77_9ACTN|nr:DUF4244 domain-containing protein [Streptomonospora nanhaiensis]WAE73683.1 DUF4244 domain-containing protein [Streptomonospora nanhaiensis]